MQDEAVERQRPLKICYLGWASHVHLERWAGYFARLGHDVTVVSISGPGRYPSGVKQYPLRFGRRSLRWRRLHLRWLLWRIRPDIVHVHWAHFAALAAGLRDVPLVVTAWGSDIYRLEEFSSWHLDRLRVALRAASVTTCDSQDMTHAIRELAGDPSTRVEVIQWGVDTELFRRRSGENAFARELGIAGRPVIFSARNFVPVYNQEAVVAAFARVVAVVPDAVLLMKNHRGEADYREKIEAQVHALGIASAVRIVDTVPYDRMPELYSLAAVTVSVPFSDSTPMTLLEAMACDSVPVVSDLPSLREWVVDGENGFLVEPKDVEGVAERIVRLLREPETRLAMAARNAELVATRASQQVNMARMDRIYRQLARSTSSGASP